MKNAYIFPGQGAQFTGMGKDLYESKSLATELFEKANEILGFRITDIMFNGSAEELKQTKVTQIAIFLHSCILAKCYESMSSEELAKYDLRAYKPDMVAGHSLGEFSALVAAKVLSFEDALNLVSIRALAMQECCENKKGTMAAILGLRDEQIVDICKTCEGMVVPANFNCDGQVVISGEEEAVNKACQLAKEAGAKRALNLAVSGAFHSPLMKDAGEKLGEAIKSIKFHEARYPIYQNVTARAETKPEEIQKNLLAQLCNPVRWTQSVKNMLIDGAGYFMEIGPGNVLQGLVKRTVGSNIVVEGLSKF